MTDSTENTTMMLNTLQELAESYKQQSDNNWKAAEAARKHTEDIITRCKKEEALYDEKDKIQKNHEHEKKTIEANHKKEMLALKKQMQSEFDKKLNTVLSKHSQEIKEIFDGFRIAVRTAIVSNADVEHKKGELMTRAKENGIDTSLNTTDIRYKIFAMKVVEDMEKEYKTKQKKDLRFMKSMIDTDASSKEDDHNDYDENFFESEEPGQGEPIIEI